MDSPPSRDLPCSQKRALDRCAVVGGEPGQQQLQGNSEQAEEDPALGDNSVSSRRLLLALHSLYLQPGTPAFSLALPSLPASFRGPLLTQPGPSAPATPSAPARPIALSITRAAQACPTKFLSSAGVLRCNVEATTAEVAENAGPLEILGGFGAGEGGRSAGWAGWRAVQVVLLFLSSYGVAGGERGKGSKSSLPSGEIVSPASAKFSPPCLHSAYSASLTPRSVLRLSYSQYHQLLKVSGPQRQQVRPFALCHLPGFLLTRPRNSRPTTTDATPPSNRSHRARPLLPTSSRPSLRPNPPRLHPRLETPLVHFSLVPRLDPPSRPMDRRQARSPLRA